MVPFLWNGAVLGLVSTVRSQHTGAENRDTHCFESAISTVLNNPHKKQAPPKAHSSLPSVPPADLPRVRRKDFDSYLKAIKPEWDKYERNTQLGKEGQAHVDPTRFGAIEEEEDEEATDADDGTLTIQRQRSSSTATSTVPPSPLPQQARSIPPLDTVPQVFFHPNFNLGDARTFDAVTEQSSLASLATPTQANIRTASRDLGRRSWASRSVEQIDPVPPPQPFPNGPHISIDLL